MTVTAGALRSSAAGAADAAGTASSGAVTSTTSTCGSATPGRLHDLRLQRHGLHRGRVPCPEHVEPARQEFGDGFTHRFPPARRHGGNEFGGREKLLIGLADIGRREQGPVLPGQFGMGRRAQDYHRAQKRNQVNAHTQDLS